MGPLQTMFAHLAQRQPMPKGTTLSPLEEMAYRQWKATLPPRLQYEGDYDLRGFFKKNPNFSVDVPGQHMTDEFKLPNHETFSDESRYYTPGTAHLGGHWVGDVFEPNSRVYKHRVDEGSDTLTPQNYQVPLGQSDQFGRELIMDPRAPRFRDPQQAGPAPPVSQGQLSMMDRRMR